MTYLTGLDAYLERPYTSGGGQETTITPTQPCSGYLENVRVAPRDQTDDLARLAAMIDPTTGSIDTTAAAALLTVIRAEAADMPIAEDVECGYDGEVDATYAAYTLRWTCPRCGRDNEEEVD